MIINHIELRKLFEDFWINKDHKEIPPIPLIPKDDPTTLFTGSGMQQLVPYLLGETHPLGKRLYNVQPCLRAQDIEEVGDNRHDTFFEMMGNWSLGDYFKREQLTWFWEFLTKVLKLPKEKLYVTVFAGTKEIKSDDESYQIWKELGITKDHIFKYENNWWSRAGSPDQMPAGEPGGPDSEVFYEFTQVEHDKKYGEKCHPNCECGRFLEIGNCVFMEYKKVSSDTFHELPKKNVDFGGGLERIMMAIENQPDQFKTSLYLPIIQEIEAFSQKSYLEEKNKLPMRVITDHIKASVFLIKDGVLPSNKEQGYVLRRLLRRAATKAFFIDKNKLDSKFFRLLSKSIIKIYSNYFKDIDSLNIEDQINIELRKYRWTLEKGLIQLDKTLKNNENLGLAVFNLFQSYGFPLEITIELLKDRGINFSELDLKQFEEAKKTHINLSRQASIGMFKGGLADQSEQTLKYHTTTHLLHQALFDVLGSDIRQEGSNITSERLRFDFYSTQRLTDDQIKKIELIINNKINEQLEVTFKILPKIEAEKLGAKSFFREKYPEMVKIYFIGPSASSGQDSFSKEFCGGPHVKNTKEIGKIILYKFEKIGSNLYRIYAK